MATEERSPRYGRREVLKRTGAFAAGAAALASAGPLLAACQAATPKGGSGKVVLMTDPNEFGGEDIRAIEGATRLKREVVKSDLTRLYAMYAAGNPPDLFRVQAAGIPQYLSRKMIKNLQPYFAA